MVRNLSWDTSAEELVFTDRWDRSKNSLKLGKTPIYRVWDLFQLGDCLVFLAFLYYAFHRELLNSLVLVGKEKSSLFAFSGPG